jgi:hypothetical protein
MKKRKTYSKEFKLDAIALVREQNYSIAEASRHLVRTETCRYFRLVKIVNRIARPLLLIGSTKSKRGNNLSEWELVVKRNPL